MLSAEAHGLRRRIEDLNRPPAAPAEADTEEEKKKNAAEQGEEEPIEDGGCVLTFCYASHVLPTNDLLLICAVMMGSKSDELSGHLPNPD